MKLYLIKKTTDLRGMKRIKYHTRFSSSDKPNWERAFTNLKDCQYKLDELMDADLDYTNWFKFTYEIIEKEVE